MFTGRCIIPATAYLRFVWETLNNFLTDTSVGSMNVEFEDVRFIRATALTDDQSVELTIIIHIGTGHFEITERGSLVVTGIIRQVEHPQPINELPPQPKGKYSMMTDRDFYKELRLRGYHYDGEFRAVVEARGDGLGGKVKWNGKWVPFLDCLLQINIVGEDTRNIVLPTRIQKIRINEVEHKRLASKLDPNNSAFDVRVCPELGIVTAGGVEITEIQTNVVGRRKPPGSPILETYRFVPLQPSAKMTAADAVQVFTQIALENNTTSKARIVEIDEDTMKPVIIEHFAKAIDDLPMVVPDLIVLSSRDTSIDSATIKNEDISAQKECLLVIATNLLSKSKLIDTAKQSLQANGYMVSRESSTFTFNKANVATNLALLSIISTEEERLVLLKHVEPPKSSAPPAVIQLSNADDKYTWLPRLIDAVQKSESVLVVSQKEQTSGILGLVNCIRREPNGDKVQCILIDDSTAPLFDVRHEFYQQQLRSQLAFNVYRNVCRIFTCMIHMERIQKFNLSLPF